MTSRFEGETQWAKLQRAAQTSLVVDLLGDVLKARCTRSAKSQRWERSDRVLLGCPKTFRQIDSYPFVQSVDLETEAIIVRGRVLRERDRFLQVCFNEETGTTVFALIADEQRIGGVDYDDLCGEHVHSVDFPDQTGISIR